MPQPMKPTSERQNIVCFAGEDWWFHNPHSNLHLMKAFAKKGRVLFVNSPGVRVPDLKKDKHAWKRIFFKLKSMLRYLKEAEPNLYVLTPIAIPLIPRHKHLILKLNTWLLSTQVRVIAHFLKMDRPILWVTVVVAKGAALKLRKDWARLLVYYCVDNMAFFPGVDKELMLALDTELQQKSDISLCVNHKMFEERKALNPAAFLVGHGVDYDHFARAEFSDLPVPEDMVKIPKPAAGYMGDIAELDFELVRFLAKKNPAVSFVFLGEIYSEVSVLSDLPNVYFLGKKRYEDLPAYLRQFDVCCLYYKVDSVFNASRNPKKILEYLAAGKPVVSVEIPQVLQYEGSILAARSYEEYHLKLTQAILHDQPADKQQRMALAGSKTWESIADEIDSLFRNPQQPVFTESNA